MFKINLFYPIEYRRRIRNYMTLKMKVRVIFNQGPLKTIELLVIHYEYVSLIDSLSAILHDFDFTYHCPFAWEGVYVYKLAFFFWLSPRTYHFLFEKRLIIDWQYFWRNIALALIL